jgi:hypothetical protein
MEVASFMSLAVPAVVNAVTEALLPRYQSVSSVSCAQAILNL